MVSVRLRLAALAMAFVAIAPAALAYPGNIQPANPQAPYLATTPGGFTPGNCIEAASAAGDLEQAATPCPTGITWPTPRDIVISNGTVSPDGLAPVNGDCVIGVGSDWAAGTCPQTPAAGTDTQLQFNASGAFAGTPAIVTEDDTGASVHITAADQIDLTGAYVGAADITTPSGPNAVAGQDGVSLFVKLGDGSGSGTANGGSGALEAGSANGGTDGDGGGWDFYMGLPGTVNGDAGDFTIHGTDATGAGQSASSIILNTGRGYDGVSGSGNAGDLTVNTGDGNGSHAGNVTFNMGRPLAGSTGGIFAVEGLGGNIVLNADDAATISLLTNGVSMNLGGTDTSNNWTINNLPTSDPSFSQAVWSNGGVLELSGATLLPLSSTLTSAHLFVGNGSNLATDTPMSGDCALSNVGAITCTKTGGVSFASSATVDATNAANISSGTLNNARLSAVPLTAFATQSGDTFLANATGSSAPPTAVAFPTSGTNGCAGAANALTYNTTTHVIGCNSIVGVSTTGTPASGNLSKFSGATSITNGDLSGDCSTSGTLAVVCTATNGTPFGTAAVANTGTSGHTLPYLDGANTFSALTTLASDLKSTGTAPTVSGCGSGATITSGSTDLVWEVTEGTLATGCVINFASTKPTKPFCQITSDAGLAFTKDESTTAVTIVNIGALSSTKMTGNCWQHA